MLPALQANCERLAAAFVAIEQLERVVVDVRSHVQQVENEVAAVEREKSVINTVFRSMKTSFFSVREKREKRGRRETERLIERQRVKDREKESEIRHVLIVFLLVLCVSFEA